MPYTLVIGDNFHRQDPEHEYDGGTYETAEAALAAARRVIDRSLIECWEPGMSAKRLYERFSAFGEITYIHPSGGGAKPEFHPWEYARARAEEIAGPGGGGSAT